MIDVATPLNWPIHRQRIGELLFVPVGPSEAAAAIIDAANSLPLYGGSHVHLVNAYSLALADKGPDIRHVFGDTSINFADGKPLSWFSRLRRQAPRVQQVRGPQLFLDVFEGGLAGGTRHFLLGSTPETLHKLEQELEFRFPGVIIVGAESPPFRVLSNDELRAQDERITRSKAQIIWVGLGTPKQDHEVKRLAANLPVIAVAVGAAFDFTAGTSKEAPAWFRSLGIEWLYRFGSEPRRLWKRYLFGNLRFIASVAKNWSKS
jgi:N-acetylglucosaminyldiphosphoundecaprenol N-acetyl-beta-D-mannosaminyltransferase